jgi:hypothetical protein
VLELDVAARHHPVPNATPGNRNAIGSYHVLAAFNVECPTCVSGPTKRETMELPLRGKLAQQVRLISAHTASIEFDKVTTQQITRAQS